MTFLESHPNLRDEIQSKIGPVYKAEPVPPVHVPDNTDDTSVPTSVIITNTLGLTITSMDGAIVAGTKQAAYNTEGGYICSGEHIEDMHAYDENGQLYVFS